MSNALKFVIVASALMIVSASAGADSLRGFIQRKDGVRYLALDADDGTHSLSRLEATTPDIKSNLNRLKSGDFIVARGAVANKIATIDSIESLGLHALVGFWISPKSEVYEFKDFSRMNLYVQSPGGQLVVKAGEFQYSVTPDKGARYGIFLSTADAVTVGSIQFRRSRVVMTVIDPKTGQTSSDMVLSPLATKSH